MDINILKKDFLVLKCLERPRSELYPDNYGPAHLTGSCGNNKPEVSNIRNCYIVVAQESTVVYKIKKRKWRGKISLYNITFSCSF